MTQTWWLSFCDRDRPTGQQFLGAAIVDVTDAEAVEGRALATQRRAAFGFGPHPDHNTDWMTAAIRKSHLMGCNPGGEVASIRIDDVPGFAERTASAATQSAAVAG